MKHGRSGMAEWSFEGDLDRYWRLVALFLYETLKSYRK